MANTSKFKSPLSSNLQHDLGMPACLSQPNPPHRVIVLWWEPCTLPWYMWGKDRIKIRLLKVFLKTMTLNISKRCSISVEGFVPSVGIYRATDILRVTHITQSTSKWVSLLNAAHGNLAILCLITLFPKRMQSCNVCKWQLSRQGLHGKGIQWIFNCMCWLGWNRESS